MRRRRWDILIGILLNRPHSVGAEIGVFEGDTTVHILTRLPNLKHFIWVDPLEHYPDHTATLRPNKPKFHDADFSAVEKKLRDRITRYQGKVKVTPLKMYSKEASKLIDDGTLDFIFIDGNHAYDYIQSDIVEWLPKIKMGGIISGHDYNVKGYRGRFGVNRAVYEVFDKNFSFENHVWWHEKV